MHRILLALVSVVITNIGASEGAVRRLSEHRDAGSYPRLNDRGRVAWLAGGVAYLWDGEADPPLIAPATVTVPARPTNATFRLTVPKPALAAPLTLRAS